MNLLHSQLASASPDGERVPSRKYARQDAGPVEKPDSDAVLRVEHSSFDSAVHEHDAPVGHDTVHVHQHQRDSFGSGTRRLPLAHSARSRDRLRSARWAQKSCVRQRSWMWSTPTTRRSAETTMSAVIFRVSKMCRPRAAGSSGPMVMGLGVMHSSVVRPMRFAPFCSSRRRSPSVRIPATVPSAASTQVMPSFFSDRSEEHTSELQSQSNLVCRLLLE